MSATTLSPRVAEGRWRLRRLAITAGVWALFAVLQAGLAKVGPQASSSEWGFGHMLLMDLATALLWIVLTPAIAAYTAVVDRRTSRPVSALAAHVVGIAAVSMADSAWRRLVVLMFGHKLMTPFAATMLYYVDFAVIVYLAVMVVARAGGAHSLHMVKARREQKLRAQVAGARLQYLEEQLRPHFLFNALGTITELAHEAPRAASRMLRQLSALLRFALDERGASVTLAEELSALEPYLDIQRVRFADWLVIEQDVDAAALELRVPRLLLQPLVENALRHGLVNRSSIGHVRIAARLEDGRLHLSVRDNGAGLPQGRPPTGFGVGLANMRERLDTIYGGDARVTLSTPAGGGTIAEVVLPMRREALPDDAGEPIDEAAPIARTPFFDWLRVHPVLAIAAGWAVWGALWLQQSVAYQTIRGRMASMSLPMMVYEHASSVAVWAALTPLVFWAARRFPLDPGRIRWSSVMHLPFACAIAVAHSAAFHQLIGSSNSLWSPSYAYMMLWSLTVYALFVGLAHYQQLTVWLRERDVAASRLEADLAEAQLVTSTSRSQPERILDTLEGLAETVISDPQETERALSALATQLRRSLDASAPSPDRLHHALT